MSSIEERIDKHGTLNKKYQKKALDYEVSGLFITKAKQEKKAN